ncbi:MAG TPA: hypothetical protein VFG91_00165 [Woeseiaceae bacterium]|nr:hypothetical protein [Woeseiaceae bacterium]
MDQLQSKGIRIYTAALFLAAILAFVLNAPQLSALAGIAVLAVIVGVMATAIGRDLTTVEIRNASRQ